MKRGLVAVLGAGGTHPPSPSTVAVHVVDANGVKDGEAATVRVEAVTVAHGRWGIGGNVVSAGSPIVCINRSPAIRTVDSFP